MKRLISLIALAVLAALATPALADFTATGTFLYEDLPIDMNGFQSPHPSRPCRYVDVKVIDNATQAILATTATDATGAFSVLVPDTQVRNIAILALTQSNYTGNLNFYVTQWSTTAIHAFQGILVAGHDPNTAIDMGPAVAHYRAGGEPFNIYDTSFDAADCIGSMEAGVRPGTLRLRYTLDVSNDQAYYNGIVNLGGNFGYDDTIILHETGHAMCAMYGGWSDSGGGTHYFEDNAQDPRLSFGEGWPTFFSSNVRDWAGYDHPHVYLNSTGDSTTGVISFSYSLEQPPSGLGEGAASEVGVQCALWDMTDGTDTPDTSPGVDDEAGYPIDRTFTELWSFIKTNLSQPPFNGSLTYEDFHELWIALVANPQAVELNDMEFYGHGIEYRTDEWEPDNTFATAGTQHTFERIGQLWKSHHTTYGQGDEDWMKFHALAGITYQINTSVMRDGADTYMELYNSAQALLASNDNATTPTPGAFNAYESLRSTLSYNPATTQDLWVRIKRGTTPQYGTISKYGNWDFQIKPTGVPATYPNVTASPGFFNVTLDQNTQTTETLNVGNTGTVDALTFNLVEATGPIGWVSENPTSGSVPAGGTTPSLLTFDATGLLEGIYKDTLEIHCNDPNLPVKTVVLILTVNPGSSTSVDDGMPAATWLGASTPNPVRGATSISYAMAQSGNARLAVYDVQGREVRRLVDGVQMAGSHAVNWDGRDAANRMVPSGIYFYRLDAEGQTFTRRLVVTR